MPGGKTMLAETAMRRALDEAKKAFAAGEVPVGAVIVRGEEILSAAHNRCEREKDPTAHAELLAIRRAAERLGDWRLSECTLYVTLEPCPMCTGAILNARIPRVVFGAWDPQVGALGGRMDLPAVFSDACKSVGGVLEEECAQLLSAFFTARRP